MIRARGTAAAILAAAALALSGCDNGTSSAPPAATALTNIAGEYTGTVQDSTLGAQTASTTLAEHGSSIGGALTIASGASSATWAIAWTLTTANTVSGSGSVSVNGPTCTFAMSGSYNPTSGQITGTYQAVSGCSGRTGSFTLNQQCSNPTAAARRRTMGVTQLC